MPPADQDEGGDEGGRDGRHVHRLRLIRASLGHADVADLLEPYADAAEDGPGR